jgi:NIPSNAP protein
MLTLSIRYRIDHHRLRAFEAYARALADPIRRCGGDLVGYFLPTRFAGRTDEALALVGFADLAAYERYREALSKDPAARECLERVERSGCIVREERAILQQT